MGPPGGASGGWVLCTDLGVDRCSYCSALLTAVPVLAGTAQPAELLASPLLKPPWPSPWL